MKPRYTLMCAALVIAALALACAYYPQLPARIPIHWDIDGAVNGYGPRVAVFAGPAMMAALTLLGMALPWLSPRAFTVDTFRATYGFIMVAVVGMVGYINVVALWAAVAGSVDVGRAMMGGIAVFMLLTGNVMGKVRRNFWIGIRTPWTLASEKVWYGTHRLAAKLIVVFSLLCLGSVVAGLSQGVCMAVLMTGLLIPVVYSLLYYKRLERSGELESQ